MNTALKDKIERIVQEGIRQGYYLRTQTQQSAMLVGSAGRYGGSASEEGGCCILGMIAVVEAGLTYETRYILDYRKLSAEILGIGFLTAHNIELQFENSQPGTIGGYFAETYT